MWYQLVCIYKISKLAIVSVVHGIATCILCIDLYIECEIPHKMSDHEEVNQEQSSCSSKCIATYNIIALLTYWCVMYSLFVEDLSS